jgi:xylulose-5-phosphate/fructose-6-phosphate phosphoketolase
MDHCFRSSNYVNVIVADKQEHIQFLDMGAAVDHCTRGIGIWPQFSTDEGGDPDVIMASCGDIMTAESLAAIDLLLEHFPTLKIRCINVVDLFRLIDPSEHPHGLSDGAWKALFTDCTPIIFNFHSYPWLVHRLTYRRPNAGKNLHVRGYREKGNIDTPLELAIRNGTDRFSVAMEAIDRLAEKGSLPGHDRSGGRARQALMDAQNRAKLEAFEDGIDPERFRNWLWTRNMKQKNA